MADKVAFIALTNSSFNQEELMFDFFSEQYKDLYSLYIHNKNPIASDYFQQFEIPSEYKVNTEWGKYSLVLATTRLLRCALQNPDNQKFVLISESHCPIYNIKETCRLIFERYQILSFSDQPNEQRLSISRFKSLIRDQNRNPFDVNHAKFVSQWFVCNRSDAEIFVNHEAKLRKYFNINKLCFADELYFHLIARHFNLEIQYKNSCYFNWNLKSSKKMINLGCRKTPKTYEKISKNFIDILRNSTDSIFMRKVCAATQIDRHYILNECKTNNKTNS